MLKLEINCDDNSSLSYIALVIFWAIFVAKAREELKDETRARKISVINSLPILFVRGAFPYFYSRKPYHGIYSLLLNEIVVSFQLT